jgi:hypothetical protein
MMGALASGNGPPKRERPALAGTGALEKGNSNAQRNISNTDLTQAAENAAVNFLIRRHFVRPTIAKIIAAEFFFAGAGR